MIFEKPVGAKRYYSGKSIALFIAAIIFIAIPFITPNIDEIGRNLSFILACLLFIIATYNYWRFKKSTFDEKVYEIPAATPSDI